MAGGAVLGKDEAAIWQIRRLEHVGPQPALELLRFRLLVSRGAANRAPDLSQAVFDALVGQRLKLADGKCRYVLPRDIASVNCVEQRECKCRPRRERLNSILPLVGTQRGIDADQSRRNLWRVVSS